MTAMDKRVLALSHQAQAQGIAVEKVLRDAISTRENLTAAIIATMKDLTPEHRRWVEEFKEIIVKGMPFGYSPLLDKPTGLLNILDMNEMTVVSPFPMNPSSTRHSDKAFFEQQGTNKAHSSPFETYVKQEIPRLTPYFQRSVVGFYLMQ